MFFTPGVKNMRKDAHFVTPERPQLENLKGRTNYQTRASSVRQAKQHHARRDSDVLDLSTQALSRNATAFYFYQCTLTVNNDVIHAR